MQNEIDHYKNFDTTHAKPVQPKFMQNLRQRKVALQSSHDVTTFFDEDVLEILKQHNNEHDRQRANTIIRMLFATA